LERCRLMLVGRKLSDEQVARDRLLTRHLFHKEWDSRRNALIAQTLGPTKVHVATPRVLSLLTRNDDPSPVPERDEIPRQRQWSKQRRGREKHRPFAPGQFAHKGPTPVELFLAFGAEAEPQFTPPTLKCSIGPRRAKKVGHNVRALG